MIRLIPAETLLSDVLEKRYFMLNTKIRDEHTRQQYRFALANFAEAVGHAPQLADLCDDNVAIMMRQLLDRQLAPRTINGRRDRIHALWTWLAKRGYIAEWPTTPPVDEPLRTPRAWTEKQIHALFNAASLERGTKKGIPKWQWWTLLLSLLWDSGERVTAIMGAKWEHLDMEGRWLHLPAELRKGRKRDMIYKLSPETVAQLRMMQRRSPEYLLPPIYNRGYLWQAYERLLKEAGLPVNRGSKFHRIRKSVASHFEAAGGDAQKLLGHSTRAITDAYLDPSICVPPQAVDRLFRP